MSFQIIFWGNKTHSWRVFTVQTCSQV